MIGSTMLICAIPVLYFYLLFYGIYEMIETIKDGELFSSSFFILLILVLVCIGLGLAFVGL